jgi:chaperonin GroEL
MGKLARDIWFGKELEEKYDAGVEKVFQVANAAYGPSAGIAAVEKNYGYPNASRDGVTNVRKVYLDDPVENMAARTVVQASEKSNQVVGDGTTAVVILAYHLYKEAKKLISGGHNRMVVARMLREMADSAVEQIDSIKKEADPALTRFVAKVSASDEALGDLIADVIERVGIESNILVEKFDGIGTYDEEVKGLYFKKGFTNEYLINNFTALESVVHDADIFITKKTLRTAGDIAPIIEKFVRAVGANHELVIIGEVIDEALATLALNKAKGVVNTTLVDIPFHGGMRALYLEDIAAYTGGKALDEGAPSSSFEIAMLGGAKTVNVTSTSTSIVDGEAAKEDVDSRVADLRRQLKEADNPIDREEITKRISLLTGKIAIIRVGAATEQERDEIKDRVDDAISATQAAIRDGVVPGGGVALARTATEHFGDALKAPFKTLVTNAGHNPDEALFKMLEAETWSGFDLRDYKNKVVSLLDAGIIDPAEVTKQTVINAVSVVTTLITTTVGITFKDRTMKDD